MRLVVCLILAAVLFQGTLAVTSKASQKKMMIEKINKQMEQSPMGRAMKKMVTLATKLNYSLDDLEVAFNNLSAQLLARKESENTHYSQQTFDHLNNVEVINSDIKKFTQAVADGEANIVALNAELDSENVTLTARNNDLETNQTHLSAALDEKHDLIENHNTEVNDFNNAINVLGEAIDLLIDAQNHYNNSGVEQFSFAQVKSTLTTFVQKMSVATKSMRASHQLFVKPVLQAMNQISSGSKDSSVQYAITALTNLRTYFSQSLDTATTIFNNNNDNVDGRISQFNTNIDLLENTLIPESQASIAHTQAELDIAEGQLTNDRASLADANQDLIDENAAFDNITTRHEAIVQKVSDEYSVVIHAQQIINDARANLEA